MIVIADYGVGNLTSIMKMINRSSAGRSMISSRPEDVAVADKIILPGMGHFDNCMRKFNQSGLRDLITKRVMEEKVSVLGICVGLQMLFEDSEEGSEKGLGWIAGKVVRFDESRFANKLTVPNMGWLDVAVAKDSYLMNGIDEPRFYFAHSYHVVPASKDVELLSAVYGYTFTAAVEVDNIAGVQFHPEKSHKFGMKLLQNFSEGKA